MVKPLISVHPDRNSMFRDACSYIVSASGRAISKRNVFYLALSGGKTPRPLYEMLAGSEIDWRSVEIFLVDERFVDHDNPESNYRMLKGALISRIKIPDRNVHPVPTGLPSPRESATAYRETLLKFMGSEPWPGFDLVILGIGADGHTASLFPGGPGLDSEGIVVSTRAPPDYTTTDRVSLSLRAINSSREIIFLATGGEKRPSVKSALGGDPGFPAAMVRARGGVRWYVTRDVID